MVYNAAVDVEKTIHYLLGNAAQASARMDRVEATLERNEKLTFQSIGLMSAQQNALGGKGSHR